MSNTLRSGETRELSLASGQSIAISTIAGAVTADVVAGTSKGTNLLSASTGGGTFGPYASGAVVRIVVAEGGIVDYDIGTAPVNSYEQNAKLAFNADGNVVGIADPVSGGASPILGVTSFTADDTGTAWAACPDIIQVGATLTAGGTTTVLLEVRTSAGVVSTAATIVADTISQTLSASFATQTFQSFRVRRSSGTGSVTITL